MDRGVLNACGCMSRQEPEYVLEVVAALDAVNTRRKPIYALGRSGPRKNDDSALRNLGRCRSSVGEKHHSARYIQRWQQGQRAAATDHLAGGERIAIEVELRCRSSRWAPALRQAFSPTMMIRSTSPA